MTAPGSGQNNIVVRSAQDEGKGCLRLVLDASLDAIEQGRLRIRDFLHTAGLGDRGWHRLELIFEEIIANIVRHGAAPGRSEIILVVVQDRDDRVELTFEDDGIPFDPLTLAPPVAVDRIEDARVGGLGVSLVRAFAQSVEYCLAPGDDNAHPFTHSKRDRNRLKVVISKQ